MIPESDRCSVQDEQVLQKMKTQIEILEQALKGEQTEDNASAEAVEGSAASGPALAASLSAAAVRRPQDAEIFGTLLPEEALADSILDIDTHYDGTDYATFPVQRPDIDKLIDGMRYIGSEAASTLADPAWACPEILDDCPLPDRVTCKYHLVDSIGNALLAERRDGSTLLILRKDHIRALPGWPGIQAEIRRRMNNPAYAKKQRNRSRYSTKILRHLGPLKSNIVNTHDNSFGCGLLFDQAAWTNLANFASFQEATVEEIIFDMLEDVKGRTEVAAFMRPGPVPPASLQGGPSPATQISDAKGNTCHFYLTDISMIRCVGGHSIPELDPRRMKLEIVKPMTEHITLLYHRTSTKHLLSILSNGLTPGGGGRLRDKRRVSCLSVYPPWHNPKGIGMVGHGDITLVYEAGKLDGIDLFLCRNGVVETAQTIPGSYLARAFRHHPENPRVGRQVLFDYRLEYCKVTAYKGGKPSVRGGQPEFWNPSPDNSPMDGRMGKCECRSCSCMMYSGMTHCLACGAMWIRGAANGLFETILFEQEQGAEASDDAASLSAAALIRAASAVSAPATLSGAGSSDDPLPSVQLTQKELDILKELNKDRHGQQRKINLDHVRRAGQFGGVTGQKSMRATTLKKFRECLDNLERWARLDPDVPGELELLEKQAEDGMSPFYAGGMVESWKYQPNFHIKRCPAWDNWREGKRPTDFKIECAEAAYRHYQWAQKHPNEELASITGKGYLTDERKKLFTDHVCLLIWGAKDPEKEAPEKASEMDPAVVASAYRSFNYKASRRADRCLKSRRAMLIHDLMVRVGIEDEHPASFNAAGDAAKDKEEEMTEERVAKLSSEAQTTAFMVTRNTLDIPKYGMSSMASQQGPLPFGVSGLLAEEQEQRAPANLISPSPLTRLEGT